MLKILKKSNLLKRTGLAIPLALSTLCTPQAMDNDKTKSEGQTSTRNFQKVNSSSHDNNIQFILPNLDSNNCSNILKKHKPEVAAQLSSLAILLAWYPWYTKSLNERSTVVLNQKPSNSLKITPSNYRGLSANIVLVQLMYPLITWELRTITGKAQEYLKRDLNTLEKFSISFGIGMSTAVIGAPAETIIIESQRNKVSARKAAMNIYSKVGWNGFPAGILPMSIRNGIFGSSLFMVAPVSTNWLVQNYPSVKKMDTAIENLTSISLKNTNLTGSILGSFLPASITTVGVSFLDRIVAMRQRDTYDRTYKSSIHAWKIAYNAHGLSALKAGMSCRLLATWVEIAGFNVLRPIFENWIDNMSAHRNEFKS